jgi:CBS domain containing-hemolysin-like protein
LPSNGGKIKKIRFWTLKIFFITFLLAGAISLLAEYLTGNISLFFAVLVLLFIILVGVTFDMIGMAFAVCDKTPFVAMASKKIKKAREALMLLKNAAAVANFCGDVIGDICGIVSGATGAAIAVKILVNNPTFPEIILSMLLSAGVAASTVALKSIGKNIAIRKNREIVGAISAFLSVFMPERKN